MSELVRTALAEYWKDKLALVWDVDDVKTQAKEQGYRLDDELAREVLSRCLHKHDATLGLSWDVIQVHIGDVAHENGLSQEDEDELLDDEAECAWCHSTFPKAEGFQRGSEIICPECAK